MLVSPVGRLEMSTDGILAKEEKTAVHEDGRFIIVHLVNTPRVAAALIKNLRYKIGCNL